VPPDLPLFAALTPPETSGAPAAHRFVGGPFSALAESLFHSIETLQAEDPFRRVDVVVPSNYLAVDLRRRLAERIASGGHRRGHANVRFSTFLDVARDVAGDVAGHPAPPGILFAAVAGAVAAAPAVEPFRSLGHRPGFLRSVEATIRDLRDAGVSARDFSEWAAAAPAVRREALETLATVYADVSRRLAPFADEVAVFRAAVGAAAAAPSREPLLVFGFYDLTGIQRDLVVAFGRGRILQFFLPSFEGDLGRFAEGTRDFLEGILGPLQKGAPGTVASAKSEWFARFADTSAGTMEPLRSDGSIRLISAADDTDEAREVAREILRSHADGIPLGRTAVILRQEESDAPRILAELARAGIPAFRLAGEPDSESPEGRAIRYWLQVEENGFRREDVLEVLELVETAQGGSNSALFRLLASQAGIVRGVEDWELGIAKLLRARPEDDEEETEKRSGSAARTGPGREAAEKLAGTWTALRESATGWSDQPLSWARWAEDLRGRMARLFAPYEPPESIATAADSIASLDSAGAVVGKQVALETFVSALERQRMPGGRLGRDGVAVLSAMSARGLSFDHVLVPGLVERKFPAVARPDPLLSDEERSEVARATSRPLAEKVFPRPDEEKLLFAACADSARRRLTLLAARRDASLDRERTPSQFFTRAVDAFEGRPVETRDYSGGRRPAALRATRLGAHGEELPALDAAEARLRTLRFHGASTVALAFPPLARAQEATRLRDRREYGPFEGRIRDAELLTGVAKRLSENPLSPSAIETFAKCSYRFFFQRVLRIRAFDEASERGEVNDLGRGALFHDAARRIVWERRGVSFRGLAESELSELARRHAADALAAWEEENGYGLGPALIRELTEARLIEELDAWLRREREDAGDFVPAGGEVRFGPRRPGAIEDPSLSTDAPLLCETADGTIALAGRIDFVAVGEAGALLRVTDFKVPRHLTTAGRIRKAVEKGQFVFAGELSQLPVYGLFAAENLSGTRAFPERIRAEYLYVGPSRAGGPIEVAPIGFEVEARGGLLEGFQSVLSTIEGALQAGVFRPRTKGFVSREQCVFCDYKPICGPGHVKRFARKEEDRDPAVMALAGLEKIL
jgi:PD-(D/E)XK nuclease superfamily